MDTLKQCSQTSKRITTPKPNDSSNEMLETPQKSFPSPNSKSDAEKKIRKRKRKKPSSDDEEALIDEAIEEKLQECAKKNNLSPIEMKKILRKIVGNDHVLALVKLQEAEELKAEDKLKQTESNKILPMIDKEEDDSFNLKLTRSKARELNKKPIPLPSLNEIEPQPEIAVLIAHDLHSDEEDEEYHPHEEELVSDDDPNGTISDIDSQPSTPYTPASISEVESPAKYSQDGLFKIPRERNDSLSQQEEIIAKRTRSKLCLETTSIEAIESTFVPPDITKDMYETDPEMDNAWMEFLSEFTKPLNATTNEEDDEADPEYVAADKVPIDREELRDVNISKKELSDLVSELFDGLLSSDDNTFAAESVLETPKKTLDKRSDKSPVKKKQRFGEISFDQIIQTQQQNNLSSYSDNYLSTSLNNNTQNEGYFHPNVMSTPQVAINYKDQRLDINEKTNVQAVAPFQHFNPPVNYTVPSVPPQQPPIFSYITGNAGSQLADNQNQSVQSSANTGSATMPLFTQQTQNTGSTVLAIQIPNSPNHAAVPYQISIPQSTLPSGSYLAIPGPYSTSLPQQPVAVIDVTASTNKTNNQNKIVVMPLSPNSSSVSAQPQTIQSTSFSEETNITELETNNTQKSKKRRPRKPRKKKPKFYENPENLPYEKWRSDARISINKSIKEDYAKKFEALKTVTIEDPVFDENQKGFTNFQRQILDQQMRIHVQFIAQNFFQTYSHPDLWKYAQGEKDMLLDLDRKREDRTDTAFNAWNLKPALNLIKQWEEELSVDSPENRELMDFLYKEVDRAKLRNNHHSTRILKFPPRVMKTILSSPVFMYPELLPRIPFRVNVLLPYQEFSPAEDHLIALGMERYFNQIAEEQAKSPNYKLKVGKLRIVCERTAREIILGKNWKRVFDRVQNQSIDKYYNPIRFYNDRKRAPPFKHELKPFDFGFIVPPEERLSELPLVWREFAFLEKSKELEISSEKELHLSTNRKSTGKVLQEKENENSLYAQNRSVLQSTDNINPTNVVIHFNYVIDGSLPNTSAQIRNALNPSLLNLALESKVEKPERNSPSLIDYSEICTRIHDPLIDPTDETANLALYRTGNNFLTPSPPSRSRLSSIASPSPILNSICQSDDNITENVDLDKSKDILPKGQKLLTDYYSIKTANKSRSSSAKLTSDERSKDSFDKRPRKLITRRKRQTVNFYRFKKHKYLGWRLLKKSKNKKQTRKLKKTLYKHLVVYKAHFYALCDKYKDDSVKYTFKFFKALELYTDLLYDLKMSCKKSNKNITNVDESVAPTKKIKLGTENPPNAKVKRAMRINEYLKRMLTPETTEELDRKDSIYALNFYDKVEENFRRAGRHDSFKKFQNILRSFDPQRDCVAEMYYKLEKLFLPHYPDLAHIFLTFLLPPEAAQVGKFFEHFMLTNMGNFMNKLNLYFSKQPAQIKKVYSALNELTEESDITIDKIKHKVLPLLKGNQFLIDWFLQIFPTERPSERLESYPENVNFKASEANKCVDSYETVSQNDLIEDTNEDHACQIRYLNGRIFYGSRVVLPAKLAFLANDLSQEEDSDSSEEDSDNENDPRLHGYTEKCLHGMREYAEKKLKNTSEMVGEESEKSEEDEPKDTEKKYVICDDVTFRAHAIRLNPSLYASNKENHHHKRVSPKKQLKINPLSKDKRKSPKKNLPKSPGGPKRSTSITQPSTLIDYAAKAVGTAKKLKSLVDDSESSSSEDSSKLKKPLKSQDKYIDSSRQDKIESSSKLDQEETQSQTDSEEKPKECCENNPTSIKLPPWTRDEDKIILEEVKFGYDTEEVLIQRLLGNLPHRTEHEITQRHHFLMDVLSQLQSRG